MNQDDRDAPTPRQTGAWAIEADLAESMVRRIVRASAAKLTSNTVRRDIPGAAEMLLIAAELFELLDAFRAWPSNPERYARERDEKCARRRALQRQVEPILLRMPGGPW